MTDIVVPQQVKVAAFAKRNTHEERIKQDEADLAVLEAPKEAPAAAVDNDDGPEPTDAEERTFKKRYGDLRRHSQKKESEMQKQLDEMRQQLTQLTAKEIKLPKSEQELASWAAQYPDVAKIVETIAIKKAKEQSAGIEERLKQLDEMEQKTLRERAEGELLRLHSDFDTIKDDDKFHEWVEKQPKWVQNALYENDNDAISAARAIDLYKADMGIRTPKAKDSGREAAKEINTRSGRSAPVGENTEGVFYESQVQKMSAEQYEVVEAEIADAMRKGKFVYDISGNAR
jgi:vacuolar-type H+-ATPase subunit I/STV1